MLDEATNDWGGLLGLGEWQGEPISEPERCGFESQTLRENT